MLSIVSAPTSAVVAVAIASKSTIVAVAALLVASRGLMAEATKAAVAAVAKVAGVAAVALLGVLRSALSRSALVSRARSSRLGSESRRAWSSALVVTGGLESIIANALSALLAVRVLMEVAWSSKGIRNGAKSRGSSGRARVLRRGRS